MNPALRLEEQRQAWLDNCHNTLAGGVNRAAAKAAEIISGQPGPLKTDQVVNVNRMVNRELQAWAAESLPQACIDWLRQVGAWRGSKTRDDSARAELKAALHYLPAFQWQPLAMPLMIPRTSWTISAAVGAIVGMLALTPLSLLILGQREIGLFLGGVLGAAGLVALVGYLADVPSVRKAIEFAAAAGAAGGIVGGVWTFWRGQKTIFLRSSLALLASWLVVVLARPRPVAAGNDIQLARLRTELEYFVQHVADLALAWAWVHPDRLGDIESTPDSAAGTLPSSVLDSLADLYRDLQTTKSAPDDMREAIEELFQRFEESGYVWKIIPPNTPFQIEMHDEFETHGIIPPGEPVRTRRPALLCHGAHVRKGQIRRA